MANNQFENEVDQLLNDFDVKPITNGLGFHHSLKEKKEIKIDLKNQSKLLKSEMETRLDQLQSKNEKSKKVVDMGELAPFYQDKPRSVDLKSIPKLGEQAEIKVTFSEANIFARSVAWSFDIFMICLFLMTTFAAMFYSANISMAFFEELLASGELAITLSIFSIMYYVFYFSFLDRTEFSTLGKNLLNMKVVSTRKNLSLIRSFSRTIFSLFSISLLGLPVILGMQDKLFDTKVVNK